VVFAVGVRGHGISAPPAGTGLQAVIR
jgi:hypothetical protein